MSDIIVKTTGLCADFKIKDRMVRAVNGAAFVHPGCAVNLLHPVDGSVDHRQHEEHLTGRLQLAVYQESGNHHHQAGKKGHTTLQEKPD